MSPFLDCNMWEVHRFPYDNVGKRTICKLYRYNSLNPSTFPTDTNNIQIPEFVINNLHEPFLDTTIGSYCAKHIQELVKEEVFCMIEISDKEWCFDKEAILNFANQEKYAHI